MKQTTTKLASLRHIAAAVLLLVVTAATAQAQNTLVSHIECYGSERVVYIEGWVYDSYTTTKWWQLGEEIELNAFVSTDPNDEGWDVRSGIVEYFARDDVNTALGISGKHNFRMEVEILGNIIIDPDPSKTLYVKVYATVNNGEGFEDILLNSPYTEVTAYEIGAEPKTNVSDVTVRGTKYDLFTGFIATSGSPDGYSALFDGKGVDGNVKEGWFVSQKNITVDFYSDRMIIPKGFILNQTFLETLGYNYYMVTRIELLAKKDICDDWTRILLAGTTGFNNASKDILCNNDDNKPYKFFRFSVDFADPTGYQIYYNELRLFGYSQSHAVSIPSRLSPYIEANKETAYTGEIVRLTLDEHIDESTLTVSDGTNNLQLTDASFRQYTFTMPDANVTVSAKLNTHTLLDDDSAQPVGEKNTDKIASTENPVNVILKDRTLYRNGDWNTLCLPFSMPTLRGTPLEGFTVMELDGTASHLDSNGTLYLNFTPATSIEAGKPYIVKSNSTGVFRVTGASGNDGNSNKTSANLMDGNINSFWTETFISDKGYIEFQAFEPVHATNYAMTTGDFARPTIWRLLAKLNEGDTWTEIDSRNSNENPEDALPNNLTSKSFALQLSGNYQYFRLEVTQSTDYGKLRINELEMQCEWLTHITNPVFEFVNVSADAPTPVKSSDGTITFGGSYSTVSIGGEDKSILFLAGNTLNACRAFFTLSEEGKNMLMQSGPDHAFPAWYTEAGCKGTLIDDIAKLPVGDDGSVTLYANWVKMGDVNGDGSVTPADAIMILYYYFNVMQDGFIEGAADLNGDGSITPADAIEALYEYFRSGDQNNNARSLHLEPGYTKAPE